MPCQSGRKIGKRIAPLAASITLAVSAPVAIAGSASWAHQSGSVSSNGAVTVKSLSGGTYVTTQNPAGAISKTNQNAATQPPTVIVQATASLPIKSEGSSCTNSTSGTTPNESADEGTAVTADRTSLLTCQGGIWKKQANNGTITPLYIKANSTPPACPSGWTQIGAWGETAANGPNTVRGCIPSGGLSCSVLYVEVESSGSPAACPIAWTDIGTLTWYFTGGNGNIRRHCYKC